MGNAPSSRQSPRQTHKTSRSNSRTSLPIPTNGTPNPSSAPGSAIPLVIGRSRDSDQRQREISNQQEREIKGLREAEEGGAGFNAAKGNSNGQGAVTFGDRPISEALAKLMPGELSTTPPKQAEVKNESEPTPQPTIPEPSIPEPSESPIQTLPTPPAQTEPADEWKEEENRREDGEDERRFSATISDMQDMLKRAERETLAMTGKGGLRWDSDDGARFPAGVSEESSAWADHRVEEDTAPRVEKRKRGDETPVDEAPTTHRSKTEVESEIESSSDSGSESSSSSHEVEPSESADSVEEQDLGDRHVESDEDVPIPRGPFESIYYEPKNATSEVSSSSEELNLVFSPPHVDEDSEVPVHRGPTVATSRSRSPSHSPSPDPYTIPLPHTPLTRTPRTPQSAIHLPSAGHFLPLIYSSRRSSPSPAQEDRGEHEHDPEAHVHEIPIPLPPPIAMDVISIQAPVPPVRPTRPVHTREDTIYYPAEPELHVDSVVEEMMTAAPVPTLDPELSIDQDPYNDLARTPIRPRDGQGDMFHFFPGPTEQSQLPSPTSSAGFIDNEHDRDPDRDILVLDPSVSPSYGELAERLKLSRSQLSVGRPVSPASQLFDQYPSYAGGLEHILPPEFQPASPAVVEPQEPPSPALSGRSPARRPLPTPPTNPTPNHSEKREDRDRERTMGVLEAGVYFMSDERWDTTIDLHGGNHRTAIAFGHHGGENQQWEFVPLGAGYAIRSLKNSTWMTVEGDVVENAAIVTSKFPVSWDVEVVESSEDSEDVVVKVHWPESNLLFGLGDTKPGTQVRLTNAMQHDVSKCWRLRPRVSSGQVVSSFETSQERQDGNTMTVTTTTTTTTVKTITKVMRKGTC